MEVHCVMSFQIKEHKQTDKIILNDVERLFIYLT